MSIADPAPPAASTAADQPVPTTHHKGLALAVIAISQLMVVLDATIVNVALERIQVALSFTSQSDLQWVVTGYALTFGGFLLLGGKLADRIGRRRVFIVGSVLFAVASLLGGIAENQTVLIAARALQGLGGAFMSPAALSLLTVVYPEGKERDRALGIWAAITAGGAALGLILGGVLTEYLSWRWVFFAQVFGAVNDGWVLGFGIAAGFLLLSAVVFGLLVRVSKEQAARALKEGLAAGG